MYTLYVCVADEKGIDFLADVQYIEEARSLSETRSILQPQDQKKTSSPTTSMEA